METKQTERSESEVAEFNDGWNCAIDEVTKAVAGYISARKDGLPVHRWEVWLQEYLKMVRE
jgi:hypothetical protein